MTQDEINRKIALSIKVTPIVEDAFFFKKAFNGELSEEAGTKAVRRMQQAGYSEEEVYEALQLADRMIENLKLYGQPCLEWGSDSF